MPADLFFMRYLSFLLFSMAAVAGRCPEVRQRPLRSLLLSRIHAVRAARKRCRADAEGRNSPCVRLGESTWSSWEPRNGQFEFAWMDRVIDRLDQAGIKVILGTTTYSIPPWLYHEHPEILVTRKGGQKATYGTARTWTSPARLPVLRRTHDPAGGESLQKPPGHHRLPDRQRDGVLRDRRADTFKGIR